MPRFSREWFYRRVIAAVPLEIDLAFVDQLDGWHFSQRVGRLRRRLRYLVSHPGPWCKGQARRLLTAWKLLRDPMIREMLQKRRQHHQCYQQTLIPAESSWLPYRILIIAEATIPQCLKYRVLQRQEMLRHRGIGCTWLSWHDADGCLEALQTHHRVIFYRTPWLPNIQKMWSEANRLGLPIHWEVDDLVFDRQLLRSSAMLQRLDRAVFRGVLRGARLYGDAMRAAKHAIASTPALASQMLAHGAISCEVIPNALDEETIRQADRLFTRQLRDGGSCRIGYGSGTNTHDFDFLEASDALLVLLRRYPYLRLRIMGALELPTEFQEVASQIERFMACSFEDYLCLLAECDIAIAPLESGIFNNCKSNIKFLEGAVLGLPVVCSARAEFTAVISHGRTGFLVDTSQQWEEAIESLVQDVEFRRQIGTAARHYVLENYKPQCIASRYLSMLDDARLVARSRPRRLLSVNVFYSPQSFGGATLVAEAINNRLPQHGWDVSVLTTIGDEHANGKSLHRYKYNNCVVFGVSESAAKSQADDVSSLKTLEAFRQVLEAVQPHLVHVHCLQTIGIDILEMCVEKNIPYVITLHDAWWLCPRQFMVTSEGEYCNQKVIEEKICNQCTGSPNLVIGRRHRIHKILQAASLLLAPSRFFADLYRANGYSSVQVNANGVAIPPAPVVNKPRSGMGPVRFAYLGGNNPVKGFPLIQRVFRRLNKKSAGVQLVLVDNTLNLGHASYFAPDLLGIANVQVVPAFGQSELDAFFSDIDVLLFPTQWKESFGLAVREALVRGVWVICTDAGGVVEDIRDGVNGRILPFTADASHLEAAVDEACELVQKWRSHETLRPMTYVRSQDEQTEELARLLAPLVGD